MVTTNISLPAQLKAQADEMVDAGFYSSFSDLVRFAIRELLREHARNYKIRCSSAFDIAAKNNEDNSKNQ